MDIKTCKFDKNDISGFKETIFSVFNKYAPINKKYRICPKKKKKMTP